MMERACFWVIACLVISLDQLVKYLVQAGLYPFKSVPIIRNFGAAFGIFPGWRILLIAVSVLVCIVVLYFHFRLSKAEGMTQFSLALILGGSVGNLIDRIFRQYVIDYIDFRFWPAFNIADVAVNFGILLIIYQLLLKKEAS